MMLLNVKNPTLDNARVENVNQRFSDTIICSASLNNNCGEN